VLNSSEKIIGVFNSSEKILGVLNSSEKMDSLGIERIIFVE
jgi:hypothetical protein